MLILINTSLLIAKLIVEFTKFTKQKQNCLTQDKANK